MVFILLNSYGKRISHNDNILTPAFEYASQAIKYAEAREMKYFNVYNTKKNTNHLLKEEKRTKRSCNTSHVVTPTNCFPTTFSKRESNSLENSSLPTITKEELL